MLSPRQSFGKNRWLKVIVDAFNKGIPGFSSINDDSLLTPLTTEDVDEDVTFESMCAGYLSCVAATNSINSWSTRNATQSEKKTKAGNANTFFLVADSVIAECVHAVESIKSDKVWYTDEKDSYTDDEDEPVPNHPWFSSLDDLVVANGDDTPERSTVQPVPVSLLDL